MLTALQAQLELGDCAETPHDYRTIACHCLPARLVPGLPQEGVAMHHQSLRGMTASEAKQAFLNLIQSWPLHKATIFDVMVGLILPYHNSTFYILLFVFCFYSNHLRRIGLEFYGLQLIKKAFIFLNIALAILFVLMNTALY